MTELCFIQFNLLAFSPKGDIGWMTIWMLDTGTSVIEMLDDLERRVTLEA